MKIKLKKPKLKIKLKAPKITAGKDLGMKNIGKAASSAVSSVGKMTGDAAKIAESSLKAQGKLLTGDFKGAGKEALQGFTSAGNIAGEVGGNVGGLAGDRKTGDIAGRVIGEGALNAATLGGAGLAKTAAQGLASGGVGGLLSSKGLQDALVSGAAAYAGADPNLIKAGLAATKGDLKSAALSSLGPLGGFDPKMLGAASSLIGGDATGAALGLAGSKAELTETQMDIAKGVAAGKSPEKIVSQQADKTARGIASDKLGSYAKNTALEQIKNKGIDFKKINERAKEYEEAGKNITNKYLKDAKGRTLYGANNAPILNPNFSAEAYDKLQNLRATQGSFEEEQKNKLQELRAAQSDYEGKQLAQLKEDAATYVPGQQLGEEKWTMDRVLGNIKREGGKALDTIKTGAGAVGGAIGGALSSAKEFAAENKGALGLAADAAAAYGGYRAGQEASEKVEDLSKQQLRDLQAQGKTFEGISYDPERYKQQREFLQQRIAGGGLTDEERQLQQQGDIRAARAAAAERASGIERQARMGAGATGAGSSLAAALSGAQSGANIQSQTNLEREARASQRLEQDIERAGKLSTQQTSEEAELARQQGTFGLDKTRAVGGVRGELGNIEMGRGAALQNLYSSGADMAKQALSLTQSQQEKANADANAKYQADMREAQLAKARNEAGMTQSATQTPPPPAPEKTAAAQRLSQGTTKTPPQQTYTPTPKNVTDKFNQTYSGPMARPQQPAQPSQPLYTPIQQPAQQSGGVQGLLKGAVANPQQAVQTVQKKVEEVKKDPLKAATGLFNQWMGK